MAKIPLSIQMYTLRDLTATDLPGVVKRLKAIGYAGVELAGYGNLKSAAEVKKAVDDAGIAVSGAHVGIEQLLKDQSKVFDDAATLGLKHVIVPFVGEEYRGLEGYQRLGKALGEIAAAAGPRGLTVCYHNHDFEFARFGGRIGLDIVYDSATPAVKAELDMFWVAVGGEDPAAYLRKLGRRVALVHLKDRVRGTLKTFAPVGSGEIDFKSIVAAGMEAGVAWYVVEQDNCYGEDPMRIAEVSHRQLGEMGLL